MQLLACLLLCVFLSGCVGVLPIPAPRDVVVAQSEIISRYDSEFSSLQGMLAWLSSAQQLDKEMGIVFQGFSNAAYAYNIRAQVELAAGNIDGFREFMDLALAELAGAREYALTKFPAI
jgi:hypothetical protein